MPPAPSAAPAPALAQPAAPDTNQGGALRLQLARALLQSTPQKPVDLLALLTKARQQAVPAASPVAPIVNRGDQPTTSSTLPYNGAPQSSSTLPNTSPTGGSTSLRYPQMAQHGGTLPGYQGLATAPQADATHVDPRVLAGLAKVGAALGKRVQIISGYRSPSYSASVGGYSTDPHTRGVAVDAYIDGVPIGDYPGAYKLLVAAGLESGAQPGFYRGKRDPMHVQIPGSGVNKGIRSAALSA